MSRKILYLVFAIFSLWGCRKADICDCLKRAGDTDSVIFFFDDVKLLNLNNKFNVFLIQDTVNKAVVSTGYNLLKLIDIQYNDSILTFTDNNICNFSRSYDVEINVNLHVKNLENIDIYGPSCVYSNDTLYFDELLIRVIRNNISIIDIKLITNHLWMEYWQSTGDATFHGRSEYFEILSHGYGQIHAFDFEADYVNLTHKTTGITELNVVKELYVSFFETGDVYYKGNPEIVKIKKNVYNKELIHVE